MRFILKVLQRLFILLIVVGVVIPVAAVGLFRFVPPPVTPLMLIRATEGHGISREWRPLREMSPHMVRAVIAAEDARFCSHRGFDVEAIERALAANEAGGRIRGGSTISQQTAKNVFLWPDRSWLRKGLEAYFTVLIETLWGKQRIMEVYLNVAETGPGLYGAEAAAQRYFRIGADEVSPAQAARIAAIFPSPLRWRAANPGPYVRRRAARIVANAGQVRRDNLDACVVN